MLIISPTMQTINRYTILREIGLVLQVHRFEITIECFKNIKLEIMKDPRFEREFMFLVDIRDTYGDVSVEETTAYGKFVAENMATENKVRLSLLTDDPEHVAKGHVFKWMLDSSNLDYEIFTTLEASLNYLNISIKDSNLVKNELDKLRTSPE